MTNKTIVAFHDDADGYGAATAVLYTRKMNNSNAEISFHRVNYGNNDLNYHFFAAVTTAAQSEEKPNIIVLDFCFDLGTMETLARQAKQMVWIDHHAGAAKHMEPWLTETGCPENVVTIYNTRRSGAWLAWASVATEDVDTDEWVDFTRTEGADEGALASIRVPTLVRYIDDYDRYKFALPLSREINAGLQLRMGDYNLGTLTEIDVVTKLAGLIDDMEKLPDDIDTLQGTKLYQDGRVLMDKRDIVVKAAEKKTFRLRLPLAVDIIGVFNTSGTEETDAIGNHLAQMFHTAVCIISPNSNGDMYLSFRSNSQCRLSALECARMFPGGGGHPHAAGAKARIHTLHAVSDEKAFEIRLIEAAV